MPQLPETNEILNTGLKAGTPYLGTPSVVDKILRQFLHSLNELRADPASLATGLMANARRLQDVFYGQTEHYLGGSFHREIGIGAFLVNDCKIGGDTSDAVVRAGIRLAKSFFEIAVQFEADHIDEQGMQEKVDALLATWGKVFLGQMNNQTREETMAKSWVQGFTRKDGVFVKPHSTKVVKKMPQRPVFHTHPKAGDKGESIRIKTPSTATAPGTWNNARQTATFVPEGDFPHKLNNVPLVSWKAPVTKAGWNYVDGINHDIEEAPLKVPKGKHPGAGVIVEEPDGRIWLVAPTNAFGGYHNTFPKGTCEQGLSMQANALKEAWEESGLQVEITGVLGDFERTTSVARMYIARRTGGNPVDMGWETQAVRLVPIDELEEHLNMIPDKNIIDAYLSRKKA